MHHVSHLLIAVAILSEARAQEVKHNIPYADPAHERQVLDVYSPHNAKNLPVIFWIHGGGWQTGDKTSVQIKPQVFVDKGYVFVSTNYRLLPSVDMATIVRDVAKSIRWVHDHIAEHGGDPKRLFIMGHSAGAQLAALVCTDDRYLKAEGLSLALICGCVPVDGDTYDVPAMIETAETRRRVHGLPQAKFGHREKFGSDPAKHRDFSAVTHVAKDKGIPPFLILHVAEHPDTSAQAQRLGNVLRAAGVGVTVFGAKKTNHSKINADLGLPDDPVTKALFEFLDKALKGARPNSGARAPEKVKLYARLAERKGWLKNYKKGTEIIQKLSALGPEGQKKLHITAYRGERVVFVGDGVPPGGTNDLMTDGGFYLRVINREGKDLRPHSVLWEVRVCGEVLQVLPENRIIIIEVTEKDWMVLQTW